MGQRRQPRSSMHHHPFSGGFFSSVRFRLTLWYFAMMLVVLISFGGSLYGAQNYLASYAVDAQLETPLYQDAQHLSDAYRPTILHGQRPTSARVSLSSREIALLLRPDGTVMDTRGPLTASAVRQVQTTINNSQPAGAVDLMLPLTGSQSGQVINGDYRLVIAPVLNQNTRIGILVVGLSRENQVHALLFWLIHGIGVMLISIIVGYWLASKALRPVQMITRMANEINATDLRRRLHLQRRDEFGELAATFDRMLARLEAAFKRQTRFTADASHELRTPLTIINLEINRALTQAQTPEEYRQVLEHIQAENEQMTAIVNSLLLLARADTGQIVLHKEEVDLSDLALACVERLLALARQHHVTLSTGELPELLVSGDPRYLSQLITNLIENGIKYTSGSGTRVRVELADKDGQWAILRVQDDGPGIAREHLPYLFDRFYRVDKARTRPLKEQPEAPRDGEEPGGTGLGLAIARWIAQAHGGEIRVESATGNGSIFEVRLPLLKSGVDEREHHTQDSAEDSLL